MNEWSKFDGDVIKNIGGKEYVLSIQEYLCKKYDITITDYKNPKQRRAIKINNTIDKLFGGLDKFFAGLDKAFATLDKTFDSMDGVIKRVGLDSKKGKKKNSIEF